MKINTVREQIRTLPDRFKKSCQLRDGKWKRILQRESDTEKIHANIVALDLETATMDDVNIAMGFNGGWVTFPHCDECDRNVDLTVQLGQEPDIESATADVCLECLQKALELCKTVTE